MKNKSTFRVGFLLHAISKLLSNPIPTDESKKELNKFRREYHIITGESPIYFPKRTKPKGYIKDVKRNNKHNKFKSYA